MTEFTEKLALKVLDSLYEFHEENYDEARYGPMKDELSLAWLRRFLKRTFRRLGFYRIEDLFNANHLRQWKRWSPYFGELEWLHATLTDDESKSLLVDLVAYHIMGFRHVRLPLSTPGYWAAKTESLTVGNGEKIRCSDGNFELVLQDFSSLGFPIRMYLPPSGHFITFKLGQYCCQRLNVRVHPGDIVIDAGVCWGDTVMHFAHEVGPEGRVYGFEFVPENLGILRRNLELNPELSKRVEIVPHPVWSSSGVDMGYSAPGPGAKAQPRRGGEVGLPTSLSIDDHVSTAQLPSVDFIKMDIEGAEFEALKGARQTIEKYKPELAICVYHSIEDFTRLARYVDGLGLGYRFALGHFTSHAEETVLFATTSLAAPGS